MWHQKAKGPPDGPPIFLIFVEKLNCPQSQAYQSISPVGTGLSLTDRALGVSLGTSIGNYSPLIAPQPVKLKIKCRKACRFESGHRHHGVRRSQHRSVSASRRKLHYAGFFFFFNCDPLRRARSLSVSFLRSLRLLGSMIEP